MAEQSTFPLKRNAIIHESLLDNQSLTFSSIYTLLGPVSNPTRFENECRLIQSYVSIGMNVKKKETLNSNLLNFW